MKKFLWKVIYVIVFIVGSILAIISDFFDYVYKNWNLLTIEIDKYAWNSHQKN